MVFSNHFYIVHIHLSPEELAKIVISVKQWKFLWNLLHKVVNRGHEVAIHSPSTSWNYNSSIIIFPLAKVFPAWNVKIVCGTLSAKANYTSSCFILHLVNISLCNCICSFDWSSHLWLNDHSYHYLDNIVLVFWLAGWSIHLLIINDVETCLSI